MFSTVKEELITHFHYICQIFFHLKLYFLYLLLLIFFVAVSTSYYQPIHTHTLAISMKVHGLENKTRATFSNAHCLQINVVNIFLYENIQIKSIHIHAKGYTQVYIPHIGFYADR